MACIDKDLLIEICSHDPFRSWEVQRSNWSSWREEYRLSEPEGSRLKDPECSISPDPRVGGGGKPGQLQQPDKKKNSNSLCHVLYGHSVSWLLSLNIKKGQWLFFWGPWLCLFFQFKYYALTEILPPRNNCQLLILAFHSPNHKPLLNLVTSARILAPKAVTHLQFVGIWVLMYLRKSQQGVALWEGGSFFWSLQYSVSLNGSQTIRNLPPLIEYFPEMTLASLY